MEAAGRWRWCSGIVMGKMDIRPVLWIVVVSLGIDAEKFGVFQKLPRILAEVGQTVHIPCSFMANVNKAIGSYQWYQGGRNGIEVSNETAEYRGRILKSGEDFMQARDASIRLRDVRVNDSGRYYCKITLMQLGEEYGAGTELTVRGTELTVRGIDSEKFSVFQKLPRILAEVGQTVHIPCSFTANVNKAIGSYQWYQGGRNGIEVSNETAEYRGRILKSGEDFMQTRDTSIRLRDVRVNDSGLYYCKVILMQLGEEYGAGTKLTVREKTKPVKSLLSILIISSVVELGLLLLATPYCVKLSRMNGKDTQQAQRQDTVIPEIACMEDNITSVLLNEVEDMDVNEEEQSIYTPMESLKTFGNSLENMMGSQSSPIKSQKQITTTEPIQYASINIDFLKQRSSLNVAAACDDLEHDYGYDELNITAKRIPNPEKVSVNQENGADSDQSTSAVNESAMNVGSQSSILNSEAEEKIQCDVCLYDAIQD
ncbi:uncharacterized protein LOC121291130 isoform X4 [Carcharodon carcharias]|uniref:uncharacterized protein LOC121291130 isoform X4 n=1 Tax=Carcharodon carcharias TaxID=13397 RepID=UPI001B7F6AEC|nr:uncharacterized protein LOC121291130 isoform X4 [Carcharodon carcharias]